MAEAGLHYGFTEWVQELALQRFNQVWAFRVCDCHGGLSEEKISHLKTSNLWLILAF